MCPIPWPMELTPGAQNKVGPDISALVASLVPIERYALRVRTEVDPYLSLYYRTEEQRREEIEAAGGDLDIDALEGERERDNASLMSEGKRPFCD